MSPKDPEWTVTPTEEEDNDIPPPPPPREEPLSRHFPPLSPSLPQATKTPVQATQDDVYRSHSRSRSKHKRRSENSSEHRGNDRMSDQMTERVSEGALRDEYEDKEDYYRARSKHRFYSKTFSHGDHNLHDKGSPYKEGLPRAPYEVYDKKLMPSRPHDSSCNKHKNDHRRPHPYHLYHSSLSYTKHGNLSIIYLTTSIH